MTTLFEHHPSSLYAPLPSRSPHMERLLADSLNPPLPGSKGELVSLRAKLWDAQKLARLVLGRECIDLQNNDILLAIRAVAEMKQELKALRKQSRKYKRLTTRLAKQKALREAADPTHTTSIDDSNDPDNAVFCSCCQKALDHANIEEQDDEEAEEEKEEENENGSVYTSMDTKKQRIGAGVLSELESKITAWNDKLTELNQTQEGRIQECQADVKEMYATLELVAVSTKADSIMVEELKGRLDLLVNAVSSFPTRTKMQELELANSSFQTEENKLKRALDCALEENRNLKDENVRLLMTIDPTACPEEISHKEPSKKRLASRFMHKLRNVYKKDGAKGLIKKEKILEGQNTVLCEELDLNMTMETFMETLGSHGDKIEDSVESPLDTSSGCSSEVVLGQDDASESIGTTANKYERFFNGRDDGSEATPLPWDLLGFDDDSDFILSMTISDDGGMILPGYKTGI